MSSLLRVIRSSIGTKWIIALTGLALVLFLMGHLAGNLLLFAGADTFNKYGHTLISNPLLIPIELGLLTVFVVHIVNAVRMTWAGRKARGTPYYRKDMAGEPSRKGLASSTMIYSGLFIAVFVVLHLKTFKYGAEYVTTVDGVAMRDLRALVVEVFQQPLYTLFYVVAMIVLGLHLKHGFSSAFQSLGVDHPELTPKLLWFGKLLAFTIGLGFASIPIFIYLYR